ncbi:PASTA domain-containing protein [Mariniflexile litorale]|uniref:PASTA domain-containing protein n=1 Tax=Mariniflexile litorale TaxID=3045158 RepID=A0AAU7EDA4_9FLAO|nr:PASTA domain-containing protein [Mariniflexile sp. KMM 9835]MDQ8212580.1 PASTA domain-containing protein [Mariniflexile sp. KMM 9835]
MSVIKFLTSKVFFKQLLLAIGAVVVLSFIVLRWLSYTTNHGEFETVPNLTGKSLSVASIELNENKLEMQVQDSANYNPDYPKFSVIDQSPAAGAKVKEDRKIYITVNPSGYRKITVPDLKERTFRQAKPTLEAVGFKVGKLTYVNNIAKDLVLEMTYKGKNIKTGDKLPKTTAIDLVLGNGNRPSSGVSDNVGVTSNESDDSNLSEDLN